MAAFCAVLQHGKVGPFDLCKKRRALPVIQFVPVLQDMLLTVFFQFLSGLFEFRVILPIMSFKSLSLDYMLPAGPFQPAADDPAAVGITSGRSDSTVIYRFNFAGGGSRDRLQYVLPSASAESRVKPNCS